MLRQMIDQIDAFFRRRASLRAARCLPDYRPCTVRQASGSSVIVHGHARGTTGLVAPLSGRETLGFLLELSPEKGNETMAAGCIDLLEIDDGTGRAVTRRGGAWLLSETALAESSPLRLHAKNPLVVGPFRQRGLDIAWALRRNGGLQLRERCLPTEADVWVAGAACRRAEEAIVDLAHDPRHLLLVSTVDPKTLASDELLLAQLVAQRHDSLLDTLIKNTPDDGYLISMGMGG